jgi:hypothetical protein
VSRAGRAGSPDPPGGFFPAVYHELKRLATARLAGERSGHSLDATALVHEAFREWAYARSWLATALDSAQ